MEQNNTTATTTPTVVTNDNNKQSSCGGNGLKITTAIASILAVCGIGFGIYGMMQGSQKDNQDCSSQGGEVAITVTDPEAENENTKEYFYIEDWGIKIKIGDNFKVVQTSTAPNFDGDGEHIAVTVTYLDDFEEITNTADEMPYLTFIRRSKSPDFFDIYDEAIGPVYNDGEYYYFVYAPSGVGVIDGLDNIEAGQRFLPANVEFRDIVNQTSNYYLI